MLIYTFSQNLKLRYNTNSPLTGGVQKLSGAVFCTDRTAEKLTILDQTNGESL